MVRPGTGLDQLKAEQLFLLRMMSGPVWQGLENNNINIQVVIKVSTMIL